MTLSKVNQDRLLRFFRETTGEVSPVSNLAFQTFSEGSPVEPFSFAVSGNQCVLSCRRLNSSSFEDILGSFYLNLKISSFTRAGSLFIEIFARRPIHADKVWQIRAVPEDILGTRVPPRLFVAYGGDQTELGLGLSTRSAPFPATGKTDLRSPSGNGFGAVLWTLAL